MSVLTLTSAQRCAQYPREGAICHDVYFDFNCTVRTSTTQQLYMNTASSTCDELQSQFETWAAADLSTSLWALGIRLFNAVRKE